MPGCSCAPNCKSNYDGGQSVRVHKFPSDRATREAWTRAVPRKDFSPTKYTVIDRASRWPVERAVEVSPHCRNEPFLSWVPQREDVFLQALDILSLTFPLDAREESRKLGATLPTLLQRENPLPQRTIPVLGAQARGRLFLRCPLDATSRGVKMSMEVRHGEELLVTIKDMEEVRALTRTSTAVGHAAQTTWTGLQPDTVSLKFMKKEIAGGSRDPEPKYGTLIRVTSAGIDIATVRKLTCLLMQRM
ncbi:uncharacterized protein LOC142575560 isoform X2 [Dermacentor variabilis]|uniref:uncharacterized protein LOC142575560 isoform X2 n=1 Tax=Dermacentor variabilis TaxID=34621 RepID=UPI003F5B4DC0